MLRTESLPGIDICYSPIEQESGADRRSRETATVAMITGHLLGPEAEIRHNADGSPFLADGTGRSISVSHSMWFAAVAVSDRGSVGIDIEAWRDQLLRVAPRVLSPREQQHYCSTPMLLLKAWTMKEAVYKAAGIRGLDFADGITLPVPCTDHPEVRVGNDLFPCTFISVDSDNILCVTVRGC